MNTIIRVTGTFTLIGLALVGLAMSFGWLDVNVTISPTDKANFYKQKYIEDKLEVGCR